MPEKDFCFFLVPAEPLKSELTPIIENLAAEYHAVVFVPHVTIYVGDSTDDEARRIGETIIRRFSPVELIAEKIDCTGLFYKTLFVQFRKSAELQEMFEAVRGECAAPSGYMLNPHLSLMYQRIPEMERRNICRTVTAPLGTYSLDTLRIVEADRTESCDTVRNWRKVFEGGLSG